MTQPEEAPQIPLEELKRISDAVLTGAIESKVACYVVMAVNRDGEISTSFNVKKTDLKRILESALEALREELSGAPAQS